MQAAQLPKGSMDRLLLVAAFAQSGFAAGLRPYKCLNPVAGETFEVNSQAAKSLWGLGFCHASTGHSWITTVLAFMYKARTEIFSVSMLKCKRVGRYSALLLG